MGSRDRSIESALEAAKQVVESRKIQKDKTIKVDMSALRQLHHDLWCLEMTDYGFDQKQFKEE